MKKKKLAGYALMGLSSALLIGCQNNQSGAKPKDGKGQAEQSAMTPQQRSFYGKLSQQGKRDFENMPHPDREKAMKNANKCSGKNSCKGQGGCSTSDHSCQGKNDCKGKGGCSMSPDESVSQAKKKAQ